MLEGTSVTVFQMAQARERRYMQQQALRGFNKTILSFTLNIPGAVKDTPLLRRVFLEGERQLVQLFTPVHRYRVQAVTGWEGLYLCPQSPQQLKEATVSLEQNHPLGRLFDLDVLDQKGQKLSRTQFRHCLVCQQQAQQCARNRTHPVEALTEKIVQLSRTYFDQQDAGWIGALAEQALLYEVSVTPKPGLVDRCNNGSHKDMNLWLFLKSASALRPTFQQCAQAGMHIASFAELFERLRQLGVLGEQAMLEATGGVNTHKGAIFSLGLLCGAAGRQIAHGTGLATSLRTLSRFFLSSEQVAAGGFGGQLFQNGSCGGIRKEAANGFPSVLKKALPAFGAALSGGCTENDAGVWTLLQLLSQVEDSNLIRRSDTETAAAVRSTVAGFLSASTTLEEVLSFAKALDAQFIVQNLSPGGCADLLAVTWFLYKLNHSKRLVN